MFDVRKCDTSRIQKHKQRRHSSLTSTFISFSTSFHKQSLYGHFPQQLLNITEDRQQLYFKNYMLKGSGPKTKKTLLPQKVHSISFVLSPHFFLTSPLCQFSLMQCLTHIRELLCAGILSSNRMCVAFYRLITPCEQERVLIQNLPLT